MINLENFTECHSDLFYGDSFLIPNGYEKIMNKMKERKIFGFDMDGNDFIIEELCDNYFFEELTKQDCIDLSNMFKFISEQFIED